MFAGQLDCCAVLKVRGGERERSFPAEKFPVTIAGGHHLYPYRTQKLSLQTLMVLSWERLGRVGSCRDPRGAGGTKVFPAPKHKEERGSGAASGSRARRAAKPRQEPRRSARQKRCAKPGRKPKPSVKAPEADKQAAGQINKPRQRPRMILSSSMAEHSAVNRRVVSSSLT